MTLGDGPWSSALPPPISTLPPPPPRVLCSSRIQTHTLQHTLTHSPPLVFLDCSPPLLVCRSMRSGHGLPVLILHVLFMYILTTRLLQFPRSPPLQPWSEPKYAYICALAICFANCTFHPPLPWRLPAYTKWHSTGSPAPAMCSCSWRWDRLARLLIPLLQPSCPAHACPAHSCTHAAWYQVGTCCCFLPRRITNNFPHVLQFKPLFRQPGFTYTLVVQSWSICLACLHTADLLLKRYRGTTRLQ